METSWAAIAAADPGCLRALAELSGADSLAALRQISNRELAGAAIQSTRRALACCDSFASSRWAALGQAYEQRIRALLHLQLALVLDFCDGDFHEAAQHYALATELADQPDRRTWQLRASCVARDDSLSDDAARREAASAVHAQAIRCGVWFRAEQRPLQLVPHLAVDATPWHDPSKHPVCVALAANYERIREEALALLARDSSGGSEGGAGRDAPVFKSERASASVRGLASMSGGNLVSGAEGKWRDVSLFVNGRRNATHAAMAPFTSSLLLSDEGQLLRDATSCVFGSAFFSLLTPGTKLRPHCGPTNIRLRAHLALAVPPGDCFMRVGNEPPRQWAEGEVLLFDDSFEHEVWNHTDAPRLVLIVDLWHPALATDEQRIGMLDPPRADRYQRIVHARELDDVEAEARKDDAGSAEKSGLVLQLLLDSLARVLGGATSVQALIDCIDSHTAGGAADVASYILPVAVPVAESTPVSSGSAGGATAEAPPVAIATAVSEPPAAVAAPLSSSTDESTRTLRALLVSELDALRVRSLIHGMQSCALRPRSFFIAWNGVLVLTYSGFPPALAELKARLNDPNASGLHLKKEGFGSMWPKSTLGALRDDAAAMSPDELRSLRQLCIDQSEGLDALRVPLSSLSLVSYAARGLEVGGHLRRSDVSLETSDAHEVDAPSVAETSRVDGVLSEWDDVEEYLPRVNAPGSRISSYREASPAGATLVSFLRLSEEPGELARLLTAFRQAVEALLPGRYAWLSDESLHCTVRALDGGAG